MLFENFWIKKEISSDAKFVYNTSILIHYILFAFRTFNSISKGNYFYLYLFKVRCKKYEIAQSQNFCVVFFIKTVVIFDGICNFARNFLSADLLFSF